MNTTAGELELEMGVVFDLIDEPDTNDDNSSFDVFDVTYH